MGLVITTADAEAGSAGRLVGRIQERRLLDGLIESVEGGGAAALIVGEAGTGKTALLTHVAEVASNRVGWRVLRARGEESEAGLAFAALADMLLLLARQ
jgi:predicted ATP-dependent serine protease